MSRALRSAGCRRRNDGGASAVEFALVSLILFTLLFGIIQYGFYLWAKQAGSHAAREAARQAAVGQLADCGAFDDFITDRVGPSSTNTPNTSRTFAEVDDDEEKVTVTVEFNSLDLQFPFIPFIEDGKVHESAVTRVEYKPDGMGSCP